MVGNMNQYERELAQLDKDYEMGYINLKELHKQTLDMERDYAAELREMAEEAAESTYNSIMGY
jgi:hypothetical protein